MNNNWL